MTRCDASPLVCLNLDQEGFWTGCGESNRPFLSGGRSGWVGFPFLLFKAFHFVALVKLRPHGVTSGSFVLFGHCVGLGCHVIVLCWLGVQLWCGIGVFVACRLYVEQKLNILRIDFTVGGEQSAFLDR